MATLNLVQIIGRLGRDPELRYTGNGNALCSFSVATDGSYNDRDGNRVERTEWHRVSVFGRQAENCANFLSKGSLVYAAGSLTTRKWQDQNGQERATAEIRAQNIQFLDRRGDDRRADGVPPSRQWPEKQARDQMPHPRDDRGQGQPDPEVPF